MPVQFTIHAAYGITKESLKLIWLSGLQTATKGSHFATLLLWERNNYAVVGIDAATIYLPNWYKHCHFRFVQEKLNAKGRMKQRTKKAIYQLNNNATQAWS